MKSRVWTEIDFGKTGVQSDFARVPYSSNTSAYGWIPVPMVCINGQSGPTALFTAGTHGDEYEGQVALLKLARELSSAKISGRVIILPALNQPAVAAGRRNSPLDDGNLNRLFPGDAQGTPTEMIAHYVVTELLSMADLIIDLHSGGSSLDHLPLALAREGKAEEETKQIHRLLRSFAAPFSVITKGTGGGAASTLYAAAEQLGVPAITTELGSGTTLSRQGLEFAEAGLRRVLRDYGIAPDLDVVQAPVTRFARSLGPASSIFAVHAGLFEPFVELGEAVTRGQVAGNLHRLDDSLANPSVLTFKSDGIVCWRRFPTLTAAGDALYGMMSNSIEE